MFPFGSIFVGKKGFPLFAKKSVFILSFAPFCENGGFRHFLLKHFFFLSHFVILLFFFLFFFESYCFSSGFCLLLCNFSSFVRLFFFTLFSVCFSLLSFSYNSNMFFLFHCPSIRFKLFFVFSFFLLSPFALPVLCFCSIFGTLKKSFVLKCLLDSFR